MWLRSRVTKEKPNAPGWYRPGDIFELPDNEARVWIQNRWASLHKAGAPDGEIEFATVSAPEQALSRRGRGRPRKE